MPVRDRVGTPPEVLPTSEARRTLPRTTREFKEKGVDAKPVFFGAHRELTGVMLSYQRYLRLLDSLDELMIALEVRRRDRNDDGSRLSIDDLAREHGLSRDDLLT